MRSTKSVNPAIVIGGVSGNGLGIARDLGQQGIDVYCVTNYRYGLTCLSRYCKGYTVLPGIESNPHQLHTFLQHFATHFQGTGVLFPTSDQPLLTLAQIYPHRGKYVTPIPAPRLIETMVHKAQFYKSLRAAEVPHPRTLFPDEEPMPEIARTLTFPVYLRPDYSQAFFEQFERKGFVAHSVREVQHYFELTDAAGLDMMVQEVIPATPTNGYYLIGYMNRQNQPQVLIAGQKVRQPSTFSNTSIDLTIPMAPVADFKPLLLKYLTAIGYQGLFGAEFMRDPRDGVCKLLEINPRSMGGSYMGTACGANDLLAAYHDVLGLTDEPISSYDIGLHYIDLVYDLMILLKWAGQGRLHRHALRPYLRKKYFNIYSRTDPLPFLIDVLGTLKTKAFLRI